MRGAESISRAFHASQQVLTRAKDCLFTELEVLIAGDSQSRGSGGGEPSLCFFADTDYGSHSAHHKPGCPAGIAAVLFSPSHLYGALEWTDGESRQLAPCITRCQREGHTGRLLVLCNGAKPLEWVDIGICIRVRERPVSGRLVTDCTIWILYTDFEKCSVLLWQKSTWTTIYL